MNNQIVIRYDVFILYALYEINFQKKEKFFDDNIMDYFSCYEYLIESLNTLLLLKINIDY